ncbi:MAG TPA: transcription antitermination factor NusB [Syntrophomonadaceae bacterium]|nr:transcription antitermination factor NusB [Syntrophomonadaceae bacterium]HNX28308.1 transcription antitermination factor NusB [Syntrophomonadaceae bacterium]HPR92515.1 transcription antitermination factor NusB [Syntrophomonadaceae bacterium]
MSRRKAREIAFKVVFQVDQVEADPRQAFDYLIADQKLNTEDREFSWQLIEGCLENIILIDEKLALYSNDWAIDRMLSVDRNIMRIASFEILFDQPQQSVIAIDEAIEIAKKYGDKNSASFVNAILDRVLSENESAGN